MNIEDILKTAHIRPTHAKLRVTVNDISKYESLWQGRKVEVREDVFEEDPAWKTEMGFPDFVDEFEPWGLPIEKDWEDEGEECKESKITPEEQCLLVTVTYPYDLIELAEFLSKFE